MFFSVVIPTYNRAEILRECLEALERQSVSKEDFEIIVVDDGSKDHTRKVVKSMQRILKNLHYIHQENQGQGIARNTGIAKAKGKVVVMIGDDMIPARDMLFEHQRIHYMYPADSDAVLGFTAWHPKLEMNNFMRWMTNGSSILGKFGGHQFAYEKLRGKKLADYNFFYTSNISLKKSLLDKYPFDPAFAGYGWEDIELGYRLTIREKLRLHYNPHSIVYHDHFMTDDGFRARMVAIGKSAWIFHKKYPELGKVPGAGKQLILKVLGSRPLIWMLKYLDKLTRNRLYDLYYYALSKRYFMEGIREGETLFQK